MLLAALGAFALITLLLQIQNGAINPLAWFARPPAADAAKGKAKAGGAKSSKTPPMIVFPADPLRQAGADYVAKRQQDIARAESIQRGVWRGVKHMDSLAAARLLAAMEQTAALQVLSHLEQRDLARIFEEAAPAQAAVWAAALLNQPQLPPVPEAFQAQAKAAGLYDDTQELLERYAAGADGAAEDPASAPAATPPATGAAPGVIPGSYPTPLASANPPGPGETNIQQSITPPGSGDRARAPALARRKRRAPPPEAIDA